MGVPEAAEQLARVAMRSGCSAREPSLIARAAKEVSHPAGAVIAREGEPGVGMFLILEGRAAASIALETLQAMAARLRAAAKGAPL